MKENIVFDDLRTVCSYDIACLSGIGRRESQQDHAYAAANDMAVFAVVCDGMGGIEGGDLASATAVEAFTEYYQYYTAQNTEEMDFCWMQQAAESVDDIVYSLKSKNGNRMGAGTTLASVAISGNRLYWLSVGDSRIYIFRRNEMVQVTNDHNYFYRLNQQLADGLISRSKYHEEAGNGEALISFIGMGGILLMDLNEAGFSLQAGDTVLLCTDGLYRSVPDDEMLKIVVSSSTAEEAICCLKKTIADKAYPWQDNYTCILIKKV